MRKRNHWYAVSRYLDRHMLRLQVVGNAALIVFMLTSCAAVPLHPGSVSRLDSTAYDVLTAAQGAMLQAQKEFAAGTLPESMRTLYNRLVDVFNPAMDTWKIYRHAVTAANEATLTRQIQAVSSALSAFQQARAIP